MTAMSCKLNGLFSIGEDFDDEDVLGTDWTVCPASGPASVAAAAAPSCTLRAPSVAYRDPGETCHQQTGERLAGLCYGSTSKSSTCSATAKTASLGFPQLSSSAQSHTHPPTMLDNSQPYLAQQQSSSHTKDLLQPCVAQDDFDDWDVDLADLDEVDSQMGQFCKQSAPIPSAATVEPSSSAKKLRPSTCGGSETLPNRTLRELNNAHKTPSSSSHSAPPRTALLSASPQSPAVFRGLTATSPPPSSFSRTLHFPHQPQKSWTTPRASPQTLGLFETVSPVPSSSVSSHPLHTPVLTNRLVQLVSASSKIPKKRSRSEAHQPRTRRFPGPAGLLPQQPQGQNLDKIVVSVPQTPAHGVVARPPSQGSSSQTEEEEFSGGAWAVMKAEMGLDERNPSCFLHTYSVVMVLRKAALKQLSRNKVPNMAVVLKSIIHTHADAKAVFKDPTGEIQGTVHRRLLEDRAEELKVGSVLLLKQVGVFSPSHRNHYLNVTPNNLLRIYSPDGVCLSSGQPGLEPISTSATVGPSVLQEPVSQMQLMFDEEDDDEGKEGCKHAERAEDPRVQTLAEDTVSVGSSRGPQQSAGNPSPPHADWDADDDLDELLGELPEDTYSF